MFSLPQLTRREVIGLSLVLIAEDIVHCFEKLVLKPSADPLAFPETRICRLEDLELGKPYPFFYLREDLGANFVVKLSADSEKLIAINAQGQTIPEQLEYGRLFHGYDLVQVEAADGVPSPFPRVTLKIIANELHAVGYS